MSTTKFDASKEKLLVENANRFVLFPINYPDLWDMYKKSLASFWTVDEIDFTEDQIDWVKKLDDNERYFIKNILAFFAFSDGIVNENLAMNFYNEIQIPEVRQLYSVQILIEAIHAHTYSIMIDTFISDSKEKDSIFNSLTTNDIVSKKANWALKWLSKENSFPERLLAFTIVEGVFFSGSFCAIFWLKSRNLMHGLTMSNEFISRDESLHCKTGVMLYNMVEQRLSQEKVHEIFMEAYTIEEEFINKSIPVSLIGMNSKLMTQYIKFVCDYWLTQLNYNKLFGVENPFSFMNYINLETKTNFFEKRNSSYSKANINSSVEDLRFTLDEDF
jgi:ribonucleoside-diphosphate reductase beta chain